MLQVTACNTWIDLFNESFFEFLVWTPYWGVFVENALSETLLNRVLQKPNETSTVKLANVILCLGKSIRLFLSGKNFWRQKLKNHRTFRNHSESRLLKSAASFKFKLLPHTITLISDGKCSDEDASFLDQTRVSFLREVQTLNFELRNVWSPCRKVSSWYL